MGHEISLHERTDTVLADDGSMFVRLCVSAGAVCEVESYTHGLYMDNMSNTASSELVLLCLRRVVCYIASEDHAPWREDSPERIRRLNCRPRTRPAFNVFRRPFHLSSLVFLFLLHCSQLCDVQR